MLAPFGTPLVVPSNVTRYHALSDVTRYHAPSDVTRYHAPSNATH